MIRIGGVDPQRVVVDVLVPLTRRAERATAVVGHHDADVHGVDAIHVVRIGEDLAVVQTDGIVAAHALPRHAAVLRAVEAATLVRGFDDRVDHVRIFWGHGEADAAQILVRG